MTDENFTWYHDNVDHVPMHPHNDWVVDRCADHCDDQLPLFSRVGRGLQGDGYIVERVTDEINQTILVGSIIDPRTGEKTEQWRTHNINGGHLSYVITKNPASNPKTFTITFTLDRPDDPEDRGWTFTTPAIPYIWDGPSAFLSTLFLKEVGAPDWEDVPLNNTPHSIDEANDLIEKLIYPEDVSREDLGAPEPGDPNTVNLTYGLGGDIDVPTLNNLARILGVNPDSLEDLANNGEDTSNYPSFGTGRNAKEYIDWHLHKDLYGGQGSADWNEIPNELKPLDGDNNNGRTVWDWIKWARDQAVDHLHKDLYGGSNSSDYADIPDSLKPLDGDNNNGRTVWDWIKWLKNMIDGISAPKMYTKDLEDTYLVSINPTPLSANTAVTPLCAIEADVHIQYFDSLPNVIIDIDIQNTSVDYVSNVVYGDSNGIRLGTAEMAVVCVKTGPNTYKPLDLSTIVLPDRSDVRNRLTYPKVDPEILSNSGFGWAGYYNFTDNHGYKNRTGSADNYSYANRLYPGVTDIYEQIVDGSCYGNWELYTGLGNVKSNQNFRWDKNGTGIFAYIFNRTVGSFGTRVLLDYNRPYQINYIQAK